VVFPSMRFAALFVGHYSRVFDRVPDGDRERPAKGRAVHAERIGQPRRRRPDGENTWVYPSEACCCGARRDPDGASQTPVVCVVLCQQCSVAGSSIVFQRILAAHQSVRRRRKSGTGSGSNGWLRPFLRAPEVSAQTVRHGRNVLRPD
jgi:hypothetical protein